MLPQHPPGSPLSPSRNRLASHGPAQIQSNHAHIATAPPLLTGPASLAPGPASHPSPPARSRPRLVTSSRAALGPVPAPLPGNVRQSLAPAGPRSPNSAPPQRRNHRRRPLSQSHPPPTSPRLYGSGAESRGGAAGLTAANGARRRRAGGGGPAVSPASNGGAAAARGRGRGRRGGR